MVKPKNKKKKNQNGNSEDDVASGVETLSVQTKESEESEDQEDKQLVKKKKRERKIKQEGDDKEFPKGATSSYQNEQDNTEAEEYPHESTIRAMYETVLDHIGGWDKATPTLLICRINSEAETIILQSTKKHVEELLIYELNDRDTSLLTTITIYLSNSPCSSKKHDCSGELINFLNENTQVILILYVANLYNIRRVSCKGERHYTWVTPDTNKANFIGLKELMEHNRCVVSAFSFAVWSELLSIVPVSDPFRSQLLDEYKRKVPGNDRSRETEDCRIRSDLMSIRYIPFVIQQRL